MLEFLLFPAHSCQYDFTRLSMPSMHSATSIKNGTDSGEKLQAMLSRPVIHPSLARLQIALVAEMLNVDPWRKYPLHLQVLNPDFMPLVKGL
jgi:hypothetical protein